MDTVKPAVSMTELISNFNYLQIIDESRKIFYVDIYKDQLEDLRTRLDFIELLPPNIAFYVTGQRGTGKSSALRYLPTPELRKKFDFVYITFYKDTDIADIEIVDVLFYIGQSLIKNNNKLTKKFNDALKELKGLYDGTLELINLKEKEIDVGFSAKLWLKFVGNLDFRKQVREIIRPNIDEFVHIVNEIILEYQEQVLKQGKRLLLILDDLEKMTDINQIKKLFIDSHQYLTQIKVPKIITFPVNLQTEDARFSAQQNAEIYRFAIRVRHTDKISNKEIEHNRDLFHEIVARRVENLDLISEDAVEKAIDYSGGILRQFIKLIQTAGFMALRRNRQNPKITKEIFMEAVAQERLTISYSKVGKKTEILKFVNKHKTLPPEVDNAVIELLLGNMIIAYPNGQAWYDVNPLVADILD